MPTAPPAPDNTTRAPIESTHNKIRDDREKKYVADREALEMAYHSDLVTIEQDKQNALTAAGLNPDGGLKPLPPPTLPTVGG